MFRLFAIMTMLFMTTDVQLLRIPLHKMDYIQSLEKVDINLQEVPSLNDNLPSVRLTNFKNVNYYGFIKIGTPPKEFKVKFVWASKNLWVFSKRCIISACSRHNQYDRMNSYTYIPNNNEIDIEYIDYRVGGFLSTDIVNVANLNVENQTFTETVYISNGNIFDTFDKQELDGLFGLSSSKLYDDGITSVIDNMIEQDLVSSRIFSFYLNRNTSADLGGILTLGGSDPAYYEGDFTYIPFTDKEHLQFTIDSIHINDFTWCEGSCQATADTSVWQIVGPQLNISHIYEFIETNPQGIVDCDRIFQLPTIRFNLGGKAFNLTGKDYIIRDPDDESICITVFSEHDPKYDDEIEWILGMPFIGRYYTEFDIEKDRVGFALAKNV